MGGRGGDEARVAGPTATECVRAGGPVGAQGGRARCPRPLAGSRPPRPPSERLG